LGGLKSNSSMMGSGGVCKDLASCECYDPEAARMGTVQLWTPVAPLPYPCNSGRCVTVGDLIYVMGGEIDVADDPCHFGAVQVLDTKGDGGGDGGKGTWKVR
jgi:hypothetical protein